MNNLSQKIEEIKTKLQGTIAMEINLGKRTTGLVEKLEDAKKVASGVHFFISSEDRKDFAFLDDNVYFCLSATIVCLLESKLIQAQKLLNKKDKKSKNHVFAECCVGSSCYKDHFKKQYTEKDDSFRDSLKRNISASVKDYLIERKAVENLETHIKRSSVIKKSSEIIQEKTFEEVMKTLIKIRHDKENVDKEQFEDLLSHFFDHMKHKLKKMQFNLIDKYKLLDES